MYQALPESASFRKRYDKHILVCFSVHSSNCCSLAKYKCYVSQGRVETLWARRITFIFLYDKFTQNNIYPMLSQSVTFCRLHIKKHFGVLFQFTVYVWYDDDKYKIAMSWPCALRTYFAYVVHQRWICAIDQSRCAIDGSLVSASIR